MFFKKFKSKKTQKDKSVGSNVVLSTDTKKNKSASDIEYVSDGIKLSDIIKFVDEEQSHGIRYIHAEYSKNMPAENEKHIFDTTNNSDDEDDFEGDYLGEVQLKLVEFDLSRIESKTFTDDKDLNNQIFNYIKDNAKNNITINKDDPIRIIADTASDKFYTLYKRGECNNIICNENFLKSHTIASWPLETNIIIYNNLPDNCALGVYKNKRPYLDMSIVSYVDKKKKEFKIAILDNPIILITEN